MLGVFAALAMRISDRFKSDYLHQISNMTKKQRKQKLIEELTAFHAWLRTVPQDSVMSPERNAELLRLMRESREVKLTEGENLRIIH